MSDMKSSKELLIRYSKARIPFITLNTIERVRALNILKEVSSEILQPFYVHTLSKGLYDLNSESIINDDKSIYSAIDYISEQMQKRQGLTFVFTEVPDIEKDTEYSRIFLDLVSLANENSGQIIIFTNDSVWSNLQRLGMIVKIDLPNETEMFKIVKEYIDLYKNEISIEWDTKDIVEVASILSGVTSIEAENVIASLIAKGKITKDDIDEIRNSKDRLFSEISGLEKITLDESVKTVGGLAGLRKWLDEKKMLLSPEKRAILKNKGLQSPRGILLVGVPGCGKSLSAKAISASWKLPLYRLDFATVQGSYVGQSEQQLKDALLMAENVSPCILWIDEIEKGLSGARSSSDGGVSTRMVGQFLFWLQECKKQVFVVATANDVSMLPTELLRRGRFDELFFVDLPTADERREILSLYLDKYLQLKFEGEVSDKIVSLTEGFTGADLESTIRDLTYRKIANEKFALDEENMINAFNNVVPLSVTSPEKIESIRRWGKERAVPASGNPIGIEALNKKLEVKVRKVLI